MEILLMVIGTLALFVGGVVFAVAPTDPVGRTRESVLLVFLALFGAALLPLAAVFWWALAVFGCHGGYECPI